MTVPHPLFFFHFIVNRSEQVISTLRQRHRQFARSQGACRLPTVADEMQIMVPLAEDVRFGYDCVLLPDIASWQENRTLATS